MKDNQSRAQQFKKLASYGMLPFLVGHTSYELSKYKLSPKPKYSEVIVRHPTRVNAMLLDYSRFIESDPESWWQAGSVAFGVDICRSVQVKINDIPGRIEIEAENFRHSIIRHAVYIMRKALGVQDGLTIILDETSGMTHVGLGSTPTIITAVASGINRLYGDVIPNSELLIYLIRNHGEEIDEDHDYLIPVQAMGAAAAVGLAGGGMIVVAGKATVIARMPLPETHRFVIGIPMLPTASDSVAALSQDTETYSFLHDLNSNVKLHTAYDVLHKLLPAMVSGDLKTIGEVIRKHRLSDNQIARFEMRYPGQSKVLQGLIGQLDSKQIEILSISSTGPTIFAFTSASSEVAAYMRENNYEAIVALPNNVGITHEMR